MVVITERALRAVSLAGTVAFMLGVVLTITDIGLRSVSTLTVKGVVDIVQLCILTGAMFAIPHGFLTDQHVAIDFVATRLPPRGQFALRIGAAVLGVLFLAGVTWFSFNQALYELGDRSQTIGIPMAWYWTPFLIGVGLAALANAIVILRLVRGDMAGS
jgi:TRAP-type C4-dicarboxylate transport system permease small subunit